MPISLWLHECVDGHTVSKIRDCPDCSERAEFVGLAFEVHQSMAVYQYVYGLKPVGMHRLLAERLFAGMRDRCARCSGGGVIGDAPRSRWRVCPQCEGTGGFWNRSPDEIDAVRRRIIKEYPDAEARWAPTDFASPWLRFSMNKNEVVERRRIGRPSKADSEKTTIATWRMPTRDVCGWRDKMPMRTIIPRTERGHTNRGICLADVGPAFAAAKRSFGRRKKWKLKGQGHCRRVTLAPRCARPAMKAVRCWQVVTPEFCGHRRNLFPLELVEKAAEILGVPLVAIISNEY